MRARSLSRLLRATADRLEPPRRTRVQPRAAPLVRIGGRWWRREELEPLPREDGTATGDVQLLP